MKSGRTFLFCIGAFSATNAVYFGVTLIETGHLQLGIGILMLALPAAIVAVLAS